MAKIFLDILNPEQFDTLQKIRDFVTGDGAWALHYAIDEALMIAVKLSAVDDPEVILKSELYDARQAACFLSNDLRTLAKAAVESEGDPDVISSGGVILDRERRALLLISLMEGEAVEPIQRGIIEYLCDESAGSDWLKAGGEKAYKADQRLSVQA